MKNLVNWICESDEVEWLNEWMTVQAIERVEASYIIITCIRGRFHCDRAFAIHQHMSLSRKRLCLSGLVGQVSPFYCPKCSSLVPCRSAASTVESHPTIWDRRLKSFIHSSLRWNRFLWDNCNVEQSSVGWRVGALRINILENQV